MTLGSPLLSFVLAIAPIGPTIMPQLRAIDPASEAIDPAPKNGKAALPAQDMPQKTVSMALPVKDMPQKTVSMALPVPSKTTLPVASAPLKPTEFDRSPVYLGCGRRAPACERLTTVGLLSGGTGLALVAGGVGLLLTPNQVIANEPAYIRNYSRIGTTVLALGIGLATTGVLMVFTAAKASRTRRRTAARMAAVR